MKASDKARYKATETALALLVAEYQGHRLRASQEDVVRAFNTMQSELKGVATKMLLRTQDVLFTSQLNEENPDSL
jgi:hypothetical protein